VKAVPWIGIEGMHALCSRFDCPLIGAADVL